MATVTDKPLALVTGAGRETGIGYEVCRQLGGKGFTVLLTARKPEQAEKLARMLADSGLEVHAYAMDVDDQGEVENVATDIGRKWGRLDALINNAAGMAGFGEKTSEADLRTAQGIMETTLFGTWRVCQAFLPWLRKSPAARIVNVSSGAGSHGDPGFGIGTGKAMMGSGYCVAKASLNALTHSLARELERSPIRVNAVCPGFTATFPGGEEMGARPVQQGAAGILWAATLGADGPTGGFFRDGKPIPW